MNCQEINQINLIPFITPLIAILGSVIIWALNEKGKRKQEIYKFKEQRYEALILSLKGFYSNSADKEKRDSFLTQLNLCWMYCPDSVIHKAYEFIQMVHTEKDRTYSDSEKENALGELILAIRYDLISNKSLSKTSLKPRDFKPLSST